MEWYSKKKKEKKWKKLGDGKTLSGGGAPTSAADVDAADSAEPALQRARSSAQQVRCRKHAAWRTQGWPAANPLA
jgi:hypothetical protein